MTQDTNPKTESKESADDTRLDGIVADEKSNPSEETGGPSGPEPTRYGDWERKGRCIDF